jgi:uncharacterized protein (TIGR02265 family)
MIPDGTTLAPFSGDVDLEKLLRLAPSTHTIKGAFVATNAAIVAKEWPQIEASLRAPPRAGQYLPFSDYPLADFLRVTDAAARRRYPGMPTCESHRLLSRATFETFSQTTLGRVTLALVSGPGSLLMKYEEIFNRMLHGPRVTVRSTGERSVEVSYVGYFGTREAIFGVLEGSVIACQFEPTVVVETKGDGRYLARVSWAPW